MTEALKLATILAADGFGYSRPANANEDRTPARLLGPSLPFPSNAAAAGGPQLRKLRSRKRLGSSLIDQPARAARAGECR